MKKIILITYLVILVTSINSIFVNAAADDVSYKLLAPISNISGQTMIINNKTFSDYVGILYKFGVSIAIGLAVIMVMWGGVEYITSDALGGKEGGKEKISQAFTGLLLALGSVLILKTIDNNLINTTLNIKEVGTIKILTNEELAIFIKNNSDPRTMVNADHTLNGLYPFAEINMIDDIAGTTDIGGGRVEVDFDGSPGAYQVKEDPNGEFLINGVRYTSIGYENLANALSNSEFNEDTGLYSGTWVGVQTDTNGQPLIGSDGKLSGQLSYGTGQINGDHTPFIALSNQQLSDIHKINPSFKLGDTLYVQNPNNGRVISVIYADNAGNRDRNYSELSPAALTGLQINFNSTGTDETNVRILLPPTQ